MEEVSPVRIAAYTQWDPGYLEGTDMSDQDIVAYAARVSNPDNQMNTETSDRLLSYLIRKSHWSPWEMVSITMEVNTTRDIGRQILRHRSFSFQEFSQRYANVRVLGFMKRLARLQDTKNRQNSIETTDDELQVWWSDMQDHVIEAATTVYDTAINRGIAKEQARAVLPEGITRSRMFMAGTLRSWIHYCALRCKHGTQKEHMEIAQLCWEELKRVYPILVQLEPEIMSMYEDRRTIVIERRKPAATFREAFADLWRLITRS